jgi:hypothetical protein
MQAMHGLTVPFRSLARLSGCVIAVVALAVTVFAPQAGAVEPPPVETYLAMGDSITYGYTAVRKAENFPNDAPAWFEEGPANYYAKKVQAGNKAKAIPSKKGLVTYNTACPGETGVSFLDKTKPAASCAAFKGGFGLHANYFGHSQIEGALSELTSENLVTKTKPAHPVPVASLNIGANDELQQLGKCKAEVKTEIEEWVLKGEPGPPEEPSKYGGRPAFEKNPGTQSEKIAAAFKEAFNGCVGANAKPLFEAIVKHIGEIDFALRTTGKYAGPLVFLGFYNPSIIALPQTDGLQESLNEAIEVTFTKSEQCENPETETEPSCKKVPNPNFDPGFVFVNPFPKFNPFPHETPVGTKEKNAVCKYTEECNPAAIAIHKAEVEKENAKEETEGKFIIIPFNGEGDIHPSKAGAETFAKLMFEKAPV